MLTLLEMNFRRAYHVGNHYKQIICFYFNLLAVFTQFNGASFHLILVEDLVQSSLQYNTTGKSRYRLSKKKKSENERIVCNSVYSLFPLIHIFAFLLLSSLVSSLLPFFFIFLKSILCAALTCQVHSSQKLQTHYFVLGGF